MVQETGVPSPLISGSQLPVLGHEGQSLAGSCRSAARPTASERPAASERFDLPPKRQPAALLPIRATGSEQPAASAGFDAPIASR